MSTRCSKCGCGSFWRWFPSSLLWTDARSHSTSWVDAGGFLCISWEFCFGGYASGELNIWNCQLGNKQSRGRRSWLHWLGVYSCLQRCPVSIAWHKILVKAYAVLKCHPEWVCLVTWHLSGEMRCLPENRKMSEWPLQAAYVMWLIQSQCGLAPNLRHRDFGFQIGFFWNGRSHQTPCIHLPWQRGLRACEWPLSICFNSTCWPA